MFPLCFLPRIVAEARVVQAIISSSSASKFNHVISTDIQVNWQARFEDWLLGGAHCEKSIIRNGDKENLFDEAKWFLSPSCFCFPGTKGFIAPTVCSPGPSKLWHPTPGLVNNLSPRIYYISTSYVIDDYLGP